MKWSRSHCAIRPATHGVHRPHPMAGSMATRSPDADQVDAGPKAQNVRARFMPLHEGRPHDRVLTLEHMDV